MLIPLVWVADWSRWKAPDTPASLNDIGDFHQNHGFVSASFGEIPKSYTTWGAACSKKSEWSGQSSFTKHTFRGSNQQLLFWGEGYVSHAEQIQVCRSFSMFFPRNPTAWGFYGTLFWDRPPYKNGGGMGGGGLKLKETKKKKPKSNSPFQTPTNDQLKTFQKD